MKLPAHVNRDAVSNRVKKIMHVAPFRQRVKAPGEVEPPTRAWQPMPAHNPDLAWPVPRDGAEEAFTKPSIGDAV